MSKTENDIRELLHNIAKEQNLADYDLEVKPISSEGANYSSRLYIAKIKNNKNVIHLFVKIANMGPDLREQMSDMNIYDKELKVYKNLIQAFKRLEEEHAVPEEHRLSVPKFYGASTEYGNEILVLEDLAVQGFEMFDRFKSIDWDYAKAAVTELAKFHALSMAYHQYNTEDYNLFVKENSCEYVTQFVFRTFFCPGFKASLNAVREEYKDRLQKFVDKIDFNMMKKLFDTTRKGILSHTDYRPSNLMHRYREDGSIQVIPMDFQTIRAGNPMHDLLYLIFLGSDQEFRRQYYQQLVDYYYTQLQDALIRLGLKPQELYSREEFDADLKSHLPYALTVSLFCLPVITVDPKDAPAADEFSDMKTSALFPERLNTTVEVFIKWDVL